MLDSEARDCVCWNPRLGTEFVSDSIYCTSELQQGESTKKFALHSLALTLVLPIEHRGRIRFVEQV